MHLPKKLILLSLLLLSAQSFAGVCDDGFNYLKSSVDLDKKGISCQDILVGTDNIKKNIKVTKIDGVEFASSVLDSFNGNRLICGRSVNDLRYTGRFGEVRNIDIRNQAVTPNRNVEKDILIPLLPQSLHDNSELSDLHAEYVSTSKSDVLNQIEISKLADKEFDLYKQNRSNLLKGIFKVLKEDSICAERICNGDDSVKCQKSLNGKQGFEFLKSKISDGLQLSSTSVAPANPTPPPTVPQSSNHEANHEEE